MWLKVRGDTLKLSLTIIGKWERCCRSQSVLHRNPNHLQSNRSNQMVLIVMQNKYEVSIEPSNVASFLLFAWCMFNNDSLDWLWSTWFMASISALSVLSPMTRGGSSPSSSNNFNIDSLWLTYGYEYMMWAYDMSSSKMLVTDDTHMTALGVLLTQLQSFEFFISSPLCRATAAIDKPGNERW